MSRATRDIFGLDDPRFRPLWIRIAVVAVALGWGLFELVTGSPGFAMLFLGAGAYAAWRFFVTFRPGDGK